MKKQLISLLGAIIFPLSALSQISNEAVIKLEGELYSQMIPGEFMNDGKSRLCYVDDSKSHTIMIYDCDLQLVTLSCENEPENVYYVDCDNTKLHEDATSLTQNLFNNDDNFEYLLKINEDITDEYSPILGYRVVSDKGTEVERILLENKYNWADVDLIRLGGKYYLEVSGSYKIGVGESVSRTSLYSIDRSTSSVKKVAEFEGVKVSPTIVDRNSTLTISLKDEAEAQVLTMTSVNGSIAKQQIIPAGMNQAQVELQGLQPGMYVVNVGGNRKNTCKIIIR